MINRFFYQSSISDFLSSSVDIIFGQMSRADEMDTAATQKYAWEQEINTGEAGIGEWKDFWEFPGGKMEDGETPEEALVREIREELSAEISVDNFLCTVEYDYPKFHLTMHCFLCSLLTEVLHLNEHEAAKWLTKDELDGVKWLPADLEVIETLKKQ